jgi:uncharacterized C2H2 Zn-finger protein
MTWSDHITIGRISRQLDLCDTHATAVVSPLVTALSTYGTEPDPEPDGDGGLRCVFCHKVYSTPKRLRDHVRKIHETVPARSDASMNGDAKMSCPECHKLYRGPQGLGAHRQKIHGVAGASRRLPAA